jgi:hypothetical protein
MYYIMCMEHENALIAAGETVLRENRFPSAEELSLVTSNASTGHDLMLLGMATECARSLRDTHKAMADLQAMIINPKTLATCTFDQRLAAMRTLMDFGKFQHSVIKEAHERVNISELNVDMVANDRKVKQTDGLSKSEKTVVREELIRLLKTTRTTTLDDGGEVGLADSV